MVTFGVALGLVGRYLQNEHQRLSGDSNSDPARPSYLPYMAPYFFTGAALFIIFGIAMAANELLQKWLHAG